MSHQYFSEKELGAKKRTNEIISSDVWGGLVRVIRHGIDRGAFGDEFPAECADDRGIIGTNIMQMGLALKAEVPTVSWPLDAYLMPDVYAILDLIEFCHLHIAEPIEGSFHSFYSHHHLSFDKERGQVIFREKINRILSRNGIAFELGKNGKITRLAPPALREALETSNFDTGDATLDQMIENARLKFISLNPIVRRESLERLWDVWERLKTIKEPENKRNSITALLDGATTEKAFRAKLEQEAKELTDIGNTFQIRHSEVTQTPLQRDEHVDYLFHRLFALVYMLLTIDGKTH